jgi:putative transposase
MPGYARRHQLSESLLYHVFNRGHDRNIVFSCDEDFEYFKGLLRVYQDRFGFWVRHWVLMPNHYHLLLEVPEPEAMSTIMAGISRSYVYYFNRRYKFVGHLWQGRFKSQPVEKESYYWACARYIERNPVKAGIVRLAWEYSYGSAALYAGVEVDKVTAAYGMYEEFGSDPERRCRQYRNFLLDDRDDVQDDELFDMLEKPVGKTKFLRTLYREGNHYYPRRQGRVNVFDL